MHNERSAVARLRMAISGVLFVLLPGIAGAVETTQPFFMVISGNANPVPTGDPCILINSEAGSGIATALGMTGWASEEVVDFCADGDPNTAAVEGQLVLTAANGDEIFAVYHTLATVNNEIAVITFAGTYEFTGGTGRFDDIRGSGSLAGQGSLLPPFEASAAMAGTFTVPRPGP